MNKGFALFELIVVMVILGILAYIALSTLTLHKGKDIENPQQNNIHQNKPCRGKL